MTMLSIHELAGTELCCVNADLAIGLHVLLTLDRTGADELVPLLDGSARPRRGNVRIDERSPYHCPEIRRRIGSLWGVEYLPDARTVRESLQMLALSPTVIDASSATLEEFGYRDLFLRPTAMLDQNSTRMVALSIALSKPEPLVMLLAEPFLGVPRRMSSVVMERVTSLASKLPVLVVTASQATARRLGGHCAELGGGFWRRIPATRPASFTLRVSGHALRALASEIVRRPRVCSLRMTARAEGYDELWLETSDPNSVSLDLIRAAQQLGARIWSLDTSAGPG